MKHWWCKQIRQKCHSNTQNDGGVSIFFFRFPISNFVQFHDANRKHGVSHVTHIHFKIQFSSFSHKKQSHTDSMMGLALICRFLWFSLLHSYICVANSAMQYGQNISIPYSQPQNDHNNMFSNDHKDNILKTKMERDREDGKSLFLLFSPSIQLIYVFIYILLVCSNQSTNFTKCKSIMANIGQSGEFGWLLITFAVGYSSHFDSTLS